MMKIKRYIFALPEEELPLFLERNKLSAQVLERKEGIVYFALYEPVKGLKPVRVEEVDTDWEKWRERFEPIELGSFVVLPPWKRPIFINPGMAFGTGLHPTTRLCARALERNLRAGMSVLDVGTGSGILAIISKLLGAGRVLGIDISEDAVRECKRNAELNRVDVECRLSDVRAVDESFDLVVANLEMRIFREVMGKLLGLVGEIGIFSGIYGENELNEFLHLLGGFEVLSVESQENWFCVVGRKKDEKLIV
ncbi:MAG: methyltransferase domain-containing protein [Aquificae bacterium]|nr:methyltransferase domain-containing protein [Aquificota bacterium]